MVYVILCGKIVLHHEKLGALGVLTMDNCLGEECQIRPTCKKKLDAAYSESECYLLAYEANKWAEIRDTLIHLGLKNDYLRFEKFVKSNFNQKNLWRMRQQK